MHGGSPFQHKIMDITVMGNDKTEKVYNIEQFSFDLASYAGGQKNITLQPCKKSPNPLVSDMKLSFNALI